MAMQWSALMACIVAARAMNVVNRESKLCLDLHAPCIDGSKDADCERVAPDTLKKGTNLQLFQCNGKKNQEFELTSSGRLRNPLTDLCLDIRAPCKDHLRTPCERIAVADLKEEANIQLYTCHEDEGILSNSWGNQKWNFEDGQLRSWLSDLCLDPVLDAKGKMVEGANAHADTCHEALYQKFDLLDATSDSSATVQAKFELLPRGAFLSASRRGRPHILMGVAGVGLLAAAAIMLSVIFVRSGRMQATWWERIPAEGSSPLADED